MTHFFQKEKKADLFLRIVRGEVLPVSMLNVLSFFFIHNYIYCLHSMTLVSMLNFLSFFFIRVCKSSLYLLHDCFDAQYSELFLYYTEQTLSQVPVLVSMLNFLSFFFIRLNTCAKSTRTKIVSMLNVLSFFFIVLHPLQYQSERKRVSMLNVLSFFFISSDNGKCYHLLQEVSMLKVLSFFFIYYKNGKDNLRKFRCSIFWAFSLLELRNNWVMISDTFVSMLNVLSFFFIRVPAF